MEKKKEKKNNRILIGVIIAVVVIAGMIVFANGNKPASNDTQEAADYEQTTWGDDSFGISPEADKIMKNYRSIIMYGIDNGGRSDIMMYICIDKKTNEAKVFSVYRDTYMQISPEEPYIIDGIEREFYKCNRAYKMDGKYGLMTELNRHLDMNARECFGMDWNTIARLIDELGGIEVDVTEGMIPWMNAQLGNENKFTKSGTQMINGDQAVQYLRCRKDPGSDATTRAARNQAVLIALFNKGQSMSKAEKMKVFDSVIDSVDTNMSRNTLTELMDSLSSMKMESLVGWPYDYEILWQDDNSYYYFVPQTLESNTTELHENAFGQEKYVPSNIVKELSQKITEKQETELK